MIKEYIKKIVENGKQEDMEKLSDMLDEVIVALKKYDDNLYQKYYLCLYQMANGDVLSEDMAHKIVEKMKPYGEKWKIEETSQLQKDYNINDISEVDFYIVMNQAFNDFRDIFQNNIELYIKYTLAFIHDEDAKSGKVFKYFTTISK